MIEHLDDAWTAAAETWTGDWDAVGNWIVWAWKESELSISVLFTGLFVLACTLSGAVYGVLSNDRNYEAVRNLCSRNTLGQTWWEIVDWGLRKVERWYGPAWSARAFSRCLMIALIYPIFALFIGLAAGGPLVLGDPRIDVGVVEANRIGGAWILLVLATTFAASFVLARINAFFLDRIDGIAAGRVFSLFARNRRDFMVYSIRLTGICIAIISILIVVSFVSRGAGLGLAVGLAGGVAVSAVAFFGRVLPTAFSAAIGFGTAFVVANAILGEDGDLIGVMVAFGTVAALGAIVAGGAASEFVLSIALSAVLGGLVGALFEVPLAAVAAYACVFLIVPALNAAADMVSWGTTRRLMRHLFPSHGPSDAGVWRAGAHLLIDLALALVFLMLLAVIMPIAFALLSSLMIGLGSESGFPWQPYLSVARDQPFSAGIGITLMLVTTLIPTFLHFAAGFVAIALPSLGRLWSRSCPEDAPITRWWLAIATVCSVQFSLFMLLVAAITTHAFLAAIFGGIGIGLATISQVVGGWTAGLF